MLQTNAIAQRGAANAEETIFEDILIPAGTIEYAQLVLEANTDAPGPVLADIMSGPLAGSKLLGSFTSTDDYLILKSLGAL